MGVQIYHGDHSGGSEPNRILAAAAQRLGNFHRHPQRLYVGLGLGLKFFGFGVYGGFGKGSVQSRLLSPQQVVCKEWLNEPLHVTSFSFPFFIRC